MDMQLFLKVMNLARGHCNSRQSLLEWFLFISTTPRENKRRQKQQGERKTEGKRCRLIGRQSQTVMTTVSQGDFTGTTLVQKNHHHPIISHQQSEQNPNWNNIVTVILIVFKWVWDLDFRFFIFSSLKLYQIIWLWKCISKAKSLKGLKLIWPVICASVLWWNPQVECTLPVK